MTIFHQFEQLYKEIFFCRKCNEVISSLVTRNLIEVACRSEIESTLVS